MNARWAAPTLLLLLCPSLSAHDGPPFAIVVDKQIGGYKVSLWGDPDVGTGTFFVYVEPPEGKSTEDVKVTVSVAPVSGRLAEVTYPAERRVLRRRVEYYAEVQFDQQEYWTVRVTVDGPEGKGEFTAEVEATPPGLGRWDLLCYAF